MSVSLCHRLSFRPGWFSSTFLSIASIANYLEQKLVHVSAVGPSSLVLVCSVGNTDLLKRSMVLCILVG